MANLCFVNTTKFWGGGEKWHFETADYLSSQGHRVFFIANPGGALHHRLEKTDLFEFKLKLTNASFLNLFKVVKLVSFFKANRIQTVIFNGSREVKIGAVSAWLAGVKAIVYRRGVASPVRNSLLNRFLYKVLITHFLANSNATVQSLFSKIGFPSDGATVRVIHNGIDHRPLSTINRKYCKDTFNPIVIGNAGRLEMQKGHEYLVKMACVLRKKNVPFQIRIAGEGPFRKRLEQLIEENGLQNRVRLDGFVSDIKGFLEQLDIFVFPSESEGFGYAIAEAMAAGLPVVAFDTGSIPEVVASNKTGYLVPPGNVHALADKTLSLAQNPELRREMGAQGRLHVQTNFDKRQQLSKIESYLCSEVLET